MGFHSLKFACLACFITPSRKRDEYFLPFVHLCVCVYLSFFRSVFLSVWISLSQAYFNKYMSQRICQYGQQLLKYFNCWVQTRLILITNLHLMSVSVLRFLCKIGGLLSTLFLSKSLWLFISKYFSCSLDLHYYILVPNVIEDKTLKGLVLAIPGEWTQNFCVWQAGY